MDPFTGVNFEDEGEPRRPARTIISVGASAYYHIKTPMSITDHLEEGYLERTLICPSAAANIAPVFVAEKPSKKMVVTL